MNEDIEIKIKDATPDQLFDGWLMYLRNQGTDRFRHSERPDHIYKLLTWFKAIGVSYDDAKGYYNKVLHALTHEEGRKNKGRYKGWKDAVETDFNGCLSEMYIEALSDDEVQDLMANTSIVKDLCDGIDKACSYNLMNEDESINEWVTQKYGPINGLIEEAHQFGNFLNIEFLRDRFYGELNG